MGFPAMYQPWTTLRYFCQYSSSPDANIQNTAEISFFAAVGTNGLIISCSSFNYVALLHSLLANVSMPQSRGWGTMVALV